MRKLWQYTKQVLLAWGVLFVALFFTALIRLVIGGVLKSFIDPIIYFKMSIIGPFSILSWILFFLPSLPFLVTPLLFTWWATKDAKKFKDLGIQTKPFIWGIFIFLPTIVVALPLYLIKRNITWNERLSAGTDWSTTGTVAPNLPSNAKTKKILKIAGFIFLLMIAHSASWRFLVENRYKPSLRPVISFLVNMSLNKNCNKKSDCSELRLLPKPFQNKKIVFDDTANVFFDPYENPSDLTYSELDVLGFLDVEYNTFYKNFVLTPFKERGLLKEREYRIVRAVYHYKCFSCIDSSDISYMVLEDSQGNRFLTLLDDTDSSVSPGKNLSWDEYVPFFMSKGRDGKEITNVKLVDIN